MAVILFQKRLSWPCLMVLDYLFHAYLLQHQPFFVKTWQLPYSCPVNDKCHISQKKNDKCHIACLCWISGPTCLPLRNGTNFAIFHQLSYATWKAKRINIIFSAYSSHHKEILPFDIDGLQNICKKKYVPRRVNL
jgi:hypothetical protein